MGSSWLEKLLEIRPEEVPDRPVKNPVLCYKTRTVKSGSMVEVECYPVYEYRYRRELERTRPTSAAVKAVNDRNARKRFTRLAECNFVPGKDYFLTLTYNADYMTPLDERGEAAPEEVEQVNRDFRNYLQRVNRARKREGLERARCMAVIEYGKNGRLHNHLLIEGGLDRDRMEALWGKGYANCDRIQASRGGLAAVTLYMTKGFGGKRDLGRHRYYYTRNLRQPAVTESRSRISRHQAELIRTDADIMGEAIIRKKYPGLRLDELTVRQSDWMPGCYIYARMRRD